MQLASVGLFFLVCSAVDSLRQCSELKKGQYRCGSAEIDVKTQQPKDCNRLDNTAEVKCVPIPNLKCDTLRNGTFTKRVPCQYTSGKDFVTALALSVFLGWLGLDRFYLGYPALGLFKLCTCGFFFVFHLVDIILIALQIVQPADGSGYRMDYFGPKMQLIRFNNLTLLQ